MSSKGLRFEALGPLRVWDGSEIALTRPARRRLLSVLLLDANQRLTVQTLINRMWGESPPGDPRNTLHAHIAGLRRQLGDVIESTADGYRLALDGNWFDAVEFERLSRAAEQSDLATLAPEVAETARAALALWRGEPFPDLTDDPAGTGRVESLIEARLRTEARHVDALLALGRIDEALPVLERLVASHPYEERFWERLMLARYRIGNTAGALRAFQSVRQLLGDELGIEPGRRLQELEERILLHHPSLGETAALPTPHNLPTSNSSFVGRDADAEVAETLLEESRLVTVTGGPGMGKTRLATEVGHRMLEAMPGGVWLVRLVGAGSEADMTATIAAAMGVVDDVSGLSELAEIVAVRPQIVILDNCEHVLDDARRFAAACLAVDGPLRILATSRQRLGLATEQVWRLTPLQLPSADGVDVFSSDATRLLIDRAVAADRSFRPRDADPAQLAALCRRTDGIPLALELAASWLPSIGVSDAIDLAGTMAPGTVDEVDPHHRSLHAAVDWSFALLAEADRPPLAAASIFSGSFVLDAFQAVAAPGMSRPEAAGTLSRLVEASLLTPERWSDGSVRYRMLEPVREYAGVQLTAENRWVEARSRHAHWHLHRAVELGEVIGRETDPAMAQAHIDAELADHRAAMRYLLDSGDHQAAASLATALTGYWFARYLGSEAIRWLDEALTGPMEAAVRRKALWTAGWAAYSKADYSTAATRYEESLALAIEAGDREAEGRALYGLGRIELPRSPDVGQAYMRQALEIFGADAGADRERGDCLIALGISAAMAGRVSEAVEVLGEGVEIMERCGSLRSQAIALRYLSLAAWYSDDEGLATDHVERAEALARRADDRPAIGGALIQRSLVETRWGEVSEAAAAMIEALDQLPARNEIDHCLVFTGVLPVLLGSGLNDLAHRLFDHVDRVFAEYGWQPLDVRMPAVADFRAQAMSNRAFTRGEPLTSAELAGLLRPVLAELAAS